ncbi:MAG TPA: ABC transporter substrate-binding protein, partial [Acidiferrobacteraceae bacterium]|nr:ABC transporter substrate-binding protein [Acidiferrobacteraceae bacterium]
MTRARIGEHRYPWARWIRGREYIIAMSIASIGLSGCRGAWNDPYPARQARSNTLYSAFVARPRYLDPARAYNADEYLFLGQICEPPLQYHYLKRPYRLAPLTARSVPRLVGVSAHGRPVSPGSPEARYTRIRIHIRPGIDYQPEPYFARLPDGHHRYFRLTRADLRGRYHLSDFHHAATRELTAADYVYEIKRLADPALHSPIYGLLSQYILGWRRFGAQLQRSQGMRVSAQQLNRIPLLGVRVLSRYVYEIDLKRPYPQFRYWLAMPFFAPMPWEADRFYGQRGMRAHDLSLNWYPVGTGPYQMTENDPARRIVLTRNPVFHGEYYPRHGAPGDRAAGLLVDAGQPLPFVHKAVFSLEKEGIPYWNKFLQGWYDRSQIGSSNFDQAIRVGVHGTPRLSRAMRRRGMHLA